MHFNTIFIGLVAAASTALAAPAVDSRAESVSAMAEAPQWIIKKFTRTCNGNDSSCKVSFKIDTQLAPATDCSYTATGNPASQGSIDGVVCGPYRVSSGWSGVFGPGNGFTTWSVVDTSKRLITWPSYADHELTNGKAVTPDKSYAPQKL